RLPKENASGAPPLRRQQASRSRPNDGRRSGSAAQDEQRVARNRRGRRAASLGQAPSVPLRATRPGRTSRVRSVQVDPPSLAGRWALVTGAGKRIGATIARTLHAAGANVAVHYFRSADDAERVVAELNSTRAGSAIAVGGDIRDIA